MRTIPGEEPLKPPTADQMRQLPAGTECAAWAQLAAAAPLMATTRALFAADADRYAHCSVQAAGLLFDYSRQRVDAPVLAAFGALADQLGVRERIAAMFRGDAINLTEGRAVLHTALRRVGAPSALMVAGVDIDAQVRAERARMLEFAEGVRGGRIRSSAGQGFSLRRAASKQLGGGWSRQKHDETGLGS